MDLRFEHSAVGGFRSKSTAVRACAITCFLCGEKSRSKLRIIAVVLLSTLSHNSARLLRRFAPLLLLPSFFLFHLYCEF